MTKAKRKLKRKIKARPPRLFSDRKGRYIRVNGQKTYIRSPISNQQLVNVIVGSFEKRKKKRKKKGRTPVSEKNSAEGLSKNDIFNILRLTGAPRDNPPGAVAVLP